ncbi:hypothetical protein N7471_007926 [Penicillium samsonianum]|uniref:uncharacterized protein n=1 Tax=Penicillium samsonianum TaxID=1882272 RepID=UPI0025469A35|nr:uncharacterized protein N7471_007926 [Penicillium samsonianum]KAJ6132711.1 hypothetical protein N7471_007926 [Penicillium samsonianum]
MNSSNQYSPQQTSTSTTGTSSAAVASSSNTAASNYTYTEQTLSEDENFQRNIDHMGGWIPSNLSHPDELSLSKS